MIEIESDFIKQ